MTTPNENQELTHTEVFDPFPKPQTIPSGWDVSELLTDTKSGPSPELDTRADEGTR